MTTAAEFSFGGLIPPSSPLILSAVVTAMPRPMPQGMFDPMPKVVGRFSDGADRELFEFYPDEISFQPAEFIGLTIEQAKNLRHAKDVAYLRER